MTFKPVLAILEKELKLELRFKFAFIFSALLDPLVNAFWFGLIYFGFFAAGAEGMGGVTKGDFIPFLALGSLANSFFAIGFGVFSNKLLQEKFWQTISAFLVAPVSRFHLLAGFGLLEFVRISFALLLFLGGCFLLKPVSGLVLFFVPLILVGLLLGSLGMGLLKGVFALTNENILPFFNVIYWGLGLVSCFYYPMDVLPKFMHPLVLANPIYHALTLIRHLWFGYPIASVWVSSMWVLGFALLMPIIGVFFFNQLWKRFGLQGY